jgi:S-adenosylmethionine:tRNA ribosyltransferase-isomerase
LRVDALHYELPPELIAQRPAPDRELARLLHLPRGGSAPEHRLVSQLADLLPRDALLVLNDTRVFPARLLGRKRDTGGRIEVFLLRRVGIRELDIGGWEERHSAHLEGLSAQTRTAEIWRALGKSSKPLKFGTDVAIAPRGAPGLVGAAGGTPGLCVRLLGRSEDDGLLEIGLWTPTGCSVDEAIAACGHVPLPPYIKRDASVEDAERYQTVYARHEGAVAAPTAGLHLTRSLLDRIVDRGCEVETVTLHVGLGTFQPVQVKDLDDHPMHAEHYIVPPAAADAVARARARGAPVVAVGTTTARALESAADPDAPGRVRAGAGETRLLIQPGYTWRVVDGLLTNFHLPSSTLLALACAFAGTERTLDAYRLAVTERYRFFSYGDATLLWRGG